MKHKGWIRIFTVLMAFFLLSLPVYAEETEDIQDFSGMTELLDQLPEGLEKEEFLPLLEENGAGSTAFVWEKILSYFTFGVKDGIRFFLRLCVFILFGALYDCLRKAFLSDALAGVFDFILVLSLGLFCYSSLENCFLITKNALTNSSTFMTASLSVLTLLISMSGGVGVAAVCHGSLQFVLAFITQGVSRFLFPILRSLFGISLVASFTETGLGQIALCFKKLVKNLTVFFFTVVSALLALKHALAAASDSVAMRSVRFAAGNFIPVIGSFVGESAKTLSASLSLVRTQCGVLFLLVLLCVMLRPIVYLIVHKAFLSLAKAMSELMGDGKSSSFLGQIISLMDLMQALLISQSCYFVFFLTLFINSKGIFT